MKSVLVTGGAGFIGSNLIEHLLNKETGLRVVNLDALTYAGNLENLKDVAKVYADRYRFVHGDIADSLLVEKLFKEESFDTVIHLAAQTHVDRSIDNPIEFVRTNVLGVASLLHTATLAWKHRKDVRFHHVSTDEVYGSLTDTGLFTENTPYDPSSPYSASKAGSDHLVRAWGKTYQLPFTISNCSNNYGPYQFPEKILPLMITNALAGKPLPIYGDGKNIRDWLFVKDHCEAIYVIATKAQSGKTYNVGGHNEWANIDVVHLLCDILMQLRPRESGHYRDLITFVSDRPGHDKRYAIDASLIARDLGWHPVETFETGLEKTVRWYLENSQWVKDICQRSYRGERLGLIND